MRDLDEPMAAVGRRLSGRCRAASPPDRFSAPILTKRFRPEQLLFELLGLIEREMARAPAVVNRLAYESRSKMTRVRIADGAGSCGM